MPQIKATVSRIYEKPKIEICYNEQQGKYYGLLMDERGGMGPVEFDLSPATLLALKGDLDAHPDIEVE